MTVRENMAFALKIAKKSKAEVESAIDEAAQDRQHRCNDTLALHVVDIMTSALRSGETGQAVELQTTCERPAALDSASARLLLV